MGQCLACPSQLALLQSEGIKLFYFHDFSVGLTLGDNDLNFIFLHHVILRKTWRGQCVVLLQLSVRVDLSVVNSHRICSFSQTIPTEHLSLLLIRWDVKIMLTFKPWTRSHVLLDVILSVFVEGFFSFFKSTQQLAVYSEPEALFSIFPTLIMLWFLETPKVTDALNLPLQTITGHHYPQRASLCSDPNTCIYVGQAVLCSSVMSCPPIC